MKFYILLALATVLRPLTAVARVVQQAAETTKYATEDAAANAGYKAVDSRIDRARSNAEGLYDAYIAAKSMADGLQRNRYDAVTKVAAKVWGA